MASTFLIQVGNTWIATRRRVRSRNRYLLPCHTRERATRFEESEAERIAADLRKREELFSRFNERQAQPVVIHPAND